MVMVCVDKDTQVFRECLMCKERMSSGRRFMRP